MTQQVSKNNLPTQVQFVGGQRFAISEWTKRLRYPLLALCLGAALVLAFAPYHLYPLGFLIPAGLLLMLNPMSPKQAFLTGFLFGCGLFGAGVHWVFIALHEFADMSGWAAGGITSIFIMFFACFPAFVCYCTQRYYVSQHMLRWVFAFPTLWVLSEWIRSWLISGFPWLLLGYTQLDSPLKGFAPVASVYGVSLATLMISGLLVNAYHARKHRLILYSSLLSIFAIIATGAILNVIQWTKPAGKPLNVTLIQGNIPQSLKWSPEYLQLSVQRYEELTQPWLAKSDLIIWPEAAIPLALQEAAPFIESMNHEAKANHTHLVLGIPVRNPTEEGYYNAIVTLGSSKTIYLQRHLVPFGQYIPFGPYLARVLKWFPIPLPDMQSGRTEQSPLMAGDIKIAAAICFEAAFPELVRTTDAGIDLLLVVTNDAWFGHSVAQAQHLQMAAMRALELGRPLLFAGNDGITAIAGPTGVIEAKAEPYQAVTLHGTVQPMQGVTPWMKHGLDPLLILLFTFLVGIRRTQREQRLILQSKTHPEPNFE
jgi:apolipoprotein N-acyltransferase